MRRTSDIGAAEAFCQEMLKRTTGKPSHRFFKEMHTRVTFGMDERKGLAMLRRTINEKSGKAANVVALKNVGQDTKEADPVGFAGRRSA